jgi:hypothetical protein
LSRVEGKSECVKVGAEEVFISYHRFSRKEAVQGDRVERERGGERERDKVMEKGAHMLVSYQHIF